ncbi:SOS response-associated peptidase [soil metagenome]
MDEKTNDLIEEFVLQGNDYRDWAPSFSIAPTDRIPIIRERADRETGEFLRKVEPAVWNFRPPFVTKTGRPQFNARLETLATNGLWKGAFASGRCIVPMRGYYEWETKFVDGKTVKFPHFIHGPGKLLAAAGIATAHTVGDEWEVSAAIVTREARDASGEVHDRMPAFLQPDVYGRWLSPDKLTDDAQKQELLDMLESVSSGVAATITSYPVDRRVNNSRVIDPADPSLIDPLAEGLAQR